MLKSLRSKKRRLRTLRREIAEPFYDKKEAAKLAALAAPKLAVITPASVDEEPAAVASAAMDNLLAGEANEQKKLDEIFIENKFSGDFQRNITSFVVSYRLALLADAKKAAEAEARSTEETLARAHYKLKLLDK